MSTIAQSAPEAFFLNGVITPAPIAAEHASERMTAETAEFGESGSVGGLTRPKAPTATTNVANTISESRARGFPDDAVAAVFVMSSISSLDCDSHDSASHAWRPR
ncbi:MAG: hypothetical protein DWQ37_15230 [Planctomycetota bacterium]|nr:MAG: hypothetical protein DWQ37_15230 [Planctomycetota bacterium]